MTDHFDIAERKLAHAHELNTRIREEFSSPTTDHKLVQSLASQKRGVIGEARAFANMAVAQGLHDLYNLLDERLAKPVDLEHPRIVVTLGDADLSTIDAARIGQEIRTALERHNGGQ